MVKDKSKWKMETCTKVHLRMIKDMVMEYACLNQEHCLEVNLETICQMEWAFFTQAKMNLLNVDSKMDKFQTEE